MNWEIMRSNGCEKDATEWTPNLTGDDFQTSSFCEHHKVLLKNITVHRNEDVFSALRYQKEKTEYSFTKSGCFQ